MSDGHDEISDGIDESALPRTIPPREPRLRRPPFFLIAVLLVGVIATWLPLAFAARARVGTSPFPRISLIQDMGTQPKFREQQSSDVFADGRADRLPVAGTVARGSLEEDDHYYRGFSESVDQATGKKAAKFFDGFPDQVKLSPAFMQRGHQRFNIYCAPCHGQDGYGNGPVQQDIAAMANGEPKWVAPANLNDDVRRGRANGHLFNTINVGIRNMPGYGAQVPPQDRWAIVAYVRALQFSQNAPPSVVPPDKLDAMKVKD